MTVSTTFTVSIGYDDTGSGNTVGLTDFTSRTLGLSTDASAQVGQLGTSSAVVTFDNNDGALTPGGGGTYSGWDFFERGLFITATVSNGVSSQKAQLFAGVINDFDLVDDGRNSTVTLTAVDAFQILGRSEVGPSGIGASDDTVGTLVELLTNIQFQIPRIGMNLPNPVTMIVTKTSATNPDILHDYIPSDGLVGAVGDIINNNVLPSAMITTAPIPEDDMVSSANWLLGVGHLNWSTDVVTFDNDVATALPFRQIDRGFDTASLTNAASLTTVRTGHIATATNATSSAKYGTRARTYTVTADGATYADPAAEDWANRFAEATFDVRQLETSTSHVADHLADASYAEWADALERPCWYLFDATFTPTGGTSVTERLVSVGRRIDATPDNASVTFRFVPGTVYTDFILDDTSQGVLDQNRLGAFS